MDLLVGGAAIDTLHVAQVGPIDPLGAPSASGYSPIVVVVLAILVALGGGAIGAAMGALPAFIMAGFLVIAGAVATAIGVDGAAGTIYAVAWGPVFGPHVAFQAGTAAAAYTRKYHPDMLDDAKNILVPLGTRWDILLVGAAFGGVGQALKMLTDFLTGGNAWGFAHIAWVIVALAFVHRLVFGYSLMGSLPSFDDDESPADEKAADGGEATRRPSRMSFYHNEADPHATYQFYWGEGILLGAFVGLLGGYIALMTSSPWLGFGISAASLVFLETENGAQAGVPRAGFPITHQITLPASVAALAAFGTANPPIPALWWAMVAALVFGVLGEVFRMVGDRLLYSWAETHLDPPAFSIVFTVFLIVLLSISGVFGTNAFQEIGLHWF